MKNEVKEPWYTDLLSRKSIMSRLFISFLIIIVFPLVTYGMGLANWLIDQESTNKAPSILLTMFVGLFNTAIVFLVIIAIYFFIRWIIKG